MSGTKTAEESRGEVALRSAPASKADLGPSVGVDPGLAAHDQLGNAALGRLLRGGATHPRIAVSQPGDLHEREADRIADQLLSPMPSEDATRVHSGSNHGIVRRQARGGIGGANGAGVDEAAMASHLGPGRTLDPSHRDAFEPRVGRTLGEVRVHTSAEAADVADSLQADAFAVGNVIAFGAGKYAPETPKGKRLLAHELAHVIQQDGTPRALQRQQAAAPTPTSQLNPVPGLGPSRAKDVDDLINAKDFQGAIDTLVHYKYMDYEIDLSLLANKKIAYDPELRSSDGSTSMGRWDYLSNPGRAEPATVRIGPGAFSSVSYLYSVTMHEYQHVLWQQALPNQQLSDSAHSQGFERPTEVEAGAWELLHATESGVARLPDKIAEIWTHLNESFWKLAAQDQATERPLVLRALRKAQDFMKGSNITLEPFASP